MLVKPPKLRSSTPLSERCERFTRATVLVCAVALMASSCAARGPAVPDEVANRPRLPGCSDSELVFLPIEQGPDASEDQSREALACFVSGRATGQAIEFQFTLLGAEGQRYRVILQSLDDGTVNLFQELDEGWLMELGCDELLISEPEVPFVEACDRSSSSG